MVNMENYAADVSSAAMTFQQGRPTAMNDLSRRLRKKHNKFDKKPGLQRVHFGLC